jgi:retinol dehydrogenase-12
MSSLPPQHGRTVVITGANTGIGRVTAERLAEAGAHVVLACRSRERTQPVLDAIGPERSTFVALDLASLASVREAAEAILALDRPIHTLINNAGLAGQRGATKDGFELAFGTNHLGHYLLTRLLLDRIVASGPARIIHVASRAHARVKGIDWDAVRRPTSTTTGLQEYGVSKLANVLFGRSLAQRLEGTDVLSCSLHPGVVATEVWRAVPAPIAALMRLFMISSEDGAKTQLWCATAPELPGGPGEYYDECRIQRTSRYARDPALAEELWRRSAEWTGLPT